MAQAQNNDSNVPTELAPKVPKKKSRPPKLTEQTQPEAPSDPADEAVVIPQLNGLIIVKTRDEIKVEGAPNITGLKVADIPLLS